VVIYPVLILLTLAMVFSSDVFAEGLFGGRSQVDVAIYLPESTKYFDSAAFYSEIQKLEHINYHLVKAPSKLKVAIESGTAEVGIRVYPPQGKNVPIQAEIIFDNSSLLSSGILASDAKFALEFLSGERSRKSISEIWDDLGTIRQEVKGEAEKVGFFVEELEEAEARLIDLNNAVSSIETGSIKNKIREFDANYELTVQEISSAKNNATEARQKIVSGENILTATSSQMVSSNANLGVISTSILNIRNSSSSPIKEQLDTVLGELSSQSSTYHTIYNEIGTSRSNISIASDNLAIVINQLDYAESLLQDTNTSMGISDSAIDDLDDSIDEVKGLVQESLSATQQTIANLNSTKALLDNLIIKIDELREMDPAFLTKPVTITQGRLYPVNDLSVMTPLGIVLLILLTAPLLAGLSVIFDREQGASLRAVISPTSRFKWMFGKTLGQLAFTMTEAILIIILGIAFFGLTIQGNFIDLFIGLIIISITFITGGLFVANFTKTQSTTILATLLVIVPMLFLSGLVFPKIFMPEFVAEIGNLLPLTLAIELISTIMVKGLPILSVGFEVLMMLLLSAFFFITTLVNRNYLK